MSSDDIVEKINELIQRATEYLEEQPAYHTLVEKYQSLSQSSQKIVGPVSMSLVVLVFLYFPYGCYQDSQDEVHRFEEQRALTRQLLIAKQTMNHKTPMVQGPKGQNFIDLIESRSQKFDLLPEQIGKLKKIEVKSLGAQLISKTAKQTAVSASYLALNLRQIIDIGYKLQSINPGLKMAGLQVAMSTEHNKYFDVTYELVSYFLPDVNLNPPESKKSRKKKRRKSRK